MIVLAAFCMQPDHCASVLFERLFSWLGAFVRYFFFFRSPSEHVVYTRVHVYLFRIIFYANTFCAEHGDEIGVKIKYIIHRTRQVGRIFMFLFMPGSVTSEYHRASKVAFTNETTRPKNKKPQRKNCYAE